MLRTSLNNVSMFSHLKSCEKIVRKQYELLMHQVFSFHIQIKFFLIPIVRLQCVLNGSWSDTIFLMSVRFFKYTEKGCSPSELRLKSALN